MATNLEVRVKKNGVNGIRRELLDSVSLKENHTRKGYRIYIPNGARLWKRENGSVIFYGVYGLLGQLSDADLEPYKIIPIDAKELRFSNLNKLSEYQYTKHQPSNGF